MKWAPRANEMFRVAPLREDVEEFIQPFEADVRRGSEEKGQDGEPNAKETNGPIATWDR